MLVCRPPEQRWRLLGSGLKQGWEIYSIFVQQGWRVSKLGGVKHTNVVYHLQYILYPLTPVMCEHMKSRTVCNESGNSGPQRERDVN